MTAVLQNSFRALADPTRREILLLLSQSDMTIAQVAEKFDMTRPAIKKHLTVLRQGRLITVHRRGREKINALAPGGLKTVTDWLGFFDRFWDESLAALKIAIETKETDHDRDDDTQIDLPES